MPFIATDSTATATATRIMPALMRSVQRRPGPDRTNAITVTDTGTTITDINTNGDLIAPWSQLEVWDASSASTASVITYQIDTGSTTTATSNIIFSNSASGWTINNWVEDKASAFRRKTRQNLSPVRNVRSEERGRDFSNASPQELIALQLLRKMVEPDEFRRYLKHGFVNVRGPTGLVYQVSRRDRIKVWDQGTHVANLCVHVRDAVPPTDEVIAKTLLAELDEPNLWRRSNIFWTDATDRDRPRLHAIGQGCIGTPGHKHNNFIIAGVAA